MFDFASEYHVRMRAYDLRAYVPTISANVRGFGPSLLFGGLLRKYTEVPSADASLKGREEAEKVGKGREKSSEGNHIK